MEILIANFAAVTVFSMPVGYAIYAFIKGKFPARSGIFSNYVVWGDKNVDPKMLTGNRSRLVSTIFIVLFGLFIRAISNQNNLIGGAYVSNLISIAIGLIIGILLCRKMVISY